MRLEKLNIAIFDKADIKGEKSELNVGLTGRDNLRSSHLKFSLFKCIDVGLGKKLLSSHKDFSLLKSIDMG